MANAMFAFFGLGPVELAVIIAVVVVLFLPALLPKIIKRFSESVKTIRDMTDQDDKKAEERKEE